MAWTLAINNHRMYYKNPDLRDSLGMKGGPRSIISGLLRTSKDLSSSIGDWEAKPGVQFGAESEEMMNDRALLEHLRNRSSEMGVVPIIHHPDRSTPGSPGFISSLQLNLQRSNYLGSKWVVVHPPSDPSPLVSRVAVADLTSDVLIKEVAKLGVGIAVENLGPGKEHRSLGDLNNLSMMIEQIQMGYALKGGESLKGKIGICLDYGHLTAFESRMGRDLGSILERIEGIRENVVVMHVHINDGSGDQHLLLDERPEGLDSEVLDRYESLLLDHVVPSMNNCRMFIIERNSPYSFEDLSEGAKLLAKSVPRSEAAS